MSWPLGTGPLSYLLTLSPFPEDVLSMAASDGYELIEDPALVLLGRLFVPTAYSIEYFCPRECVDVCECVMPPGLGNTIVKQ